MADREYHLWRRYPTKPFTRWACTVVQAATEDGFKVIDFDRNVAQPSFLHGLGNTLRTGQMLRGSVVQDGIVIETEDWAVIGDPGHFAVAIRQVPNAVLRGVGRS